MPPVSVPALPSPALRLARRAWRLLQADSARSMAMAAQALEQAGDDASARSWALLVLGFNQLNLSTPARAIDTLRQARDGFETTGQVDGRVLADTGIARAWWRQGRLRVAHEQLMALHDEGLQALRHEQRGVLLNAIAGSHSMRGDAEQALAYLFAALRDTPVSRAPGFDVVLHCNLGHELLQLGDCDAALVHLDEGLQRCRRLANPRLLAAVLINRVIALSELGRAGDALRDIDEICELPADEGGRGRNAACFEILARVALRAGQVERGRQLIAAAEGAHHEDIADELHELVQARAALALADGQPGQAEALLAPLRERLLDPRDDDGLSPRIRCNGLQQLADLAEQQGRSADALQWLRAWQRFQLDRAARASRARYQSAALQTELMRLQRQLREQESRRQRTERARAELQDINEQLSRKVREVEQLRDALREQATRDPLTGLHNRRHLNDTLPALVAEAQRRGQPLAAVIIDLDHFKSVNDRHGHDVGDRLLKAFGDLLVGEVRPGDLVCRWGGEEFCLLLPGARAADASHRMERLLARWRDRCLEHEGAALQDLSFSAGVSDLQAAGGCAVTLLQSADRALLNAKRAGRSRVEVALAP